MKKDISIENTTFSYGLGEENLLDGINLNIEKGKFIGMWKINTSEGNIKIFESKRGDS